jgi:hypothetical protein
VRRLSISRPLQLASVGALCTLCAVPAYGAVAHAASLPTITPVPFAAGTSTEADPDDIAVLNGNLYVTYQNGVGPDGTPGTNGNTQSTIVEYSPTGATVATWSLTGRCDGLGADPANNRMLATINEDNNSSFAVITPGNPTPALYTYSPDPAQEAAGESGPNGGTDSVVVGPDGTIYIAHSNPDPGVGNTAATYTAKLRGSTVDLTPLFGVQDPATDAVTDAALTLALTDPDSNLFVPPTAPVLGGTFIQDSQGDGKLIEVSDPHTPQQALKQLTLTNAETPALQPTIDDFVEITRPGTLYVVDQGADTVSTVDTSDIPVGSFVIAQPSDDTTTPATVGQLGLLDPATGVITHFPNAFNSPKGLVFVPSSSPVPALPESPAAVALPLVFVGLAGGAFALKRRRIAG